MNSTEPVEILPYDDNWEDMFAQEKLRLLGLMPLAKVEHIGSTAVRGLSSKPIIDIMLGLERLESIEWQGLAEAGYIYQSDFETINPERRFFIKLHDDKIVYQLHIVESSSYFWRHKLAFRNVLRTRPDIAAEYVQHKMELSHQYRHERQVYAGAKTDFIRAALIRAGYDPDAI